MEKRNKLFVLIFFVGLVVSIFAACDNGNTPHSHSFGEWTMKTAATCTEAEVEKRTCSCGNEETRNSTVNLALNHDWNITGGTAPTCLDAGNGTGNCKRCPETITNSVINALGHLMSGWTEKTVATCTAAKVEKNNCTRSGCSLPEEIRSVGEPNPTAHTFGGWTMKTAANCTEAEVEKRTCSCGNEETRNSTVNTELGHSYSIWTQITPAGETTDGEEENSCKNDPSHKNGTRLLYATGTEGLAFTLISNDEAYSVSAGTVTGGAVHIPDFRRPDPGVYEYLPVTQIANQAFQGYSGLTIVTIGDSITRIGFFAFLSCTDLTNIILPASITTISIDSFRNCTSLQTIICFSKNPPILQEDFDGYHLFDNTNNCPIKVPKDSVDVYKAANGWSDYAGRISAIED